MGELPGANALLERHQRQIDLLRLVHPLLRMTFRIRGTLRPRQINDVQPPLSRRDPTVVAYDMSTTR